VQVSTTTLPVKEVHTPGASFGQRQNYAVLREFRSVPVTPTVWWAREAVFGKNLVNEWISVRGEK
jgi:hypothetical protein